MTNFECVSELKADWALLQVTASTREPKDKVHLQEPGDGYLQDEQTFSTTSSKCRNEAGILVGAKSHQTVTHSMGIDLFELCLVFVPLHTALSQQMLGIC
jgi:hypothetical protein